MFKSWFIFFILMLTIILQVFAQPGTWTWMHGSNTTTDPGDFGNLGISSASNHPPPFYEAAEFKDLQGNFWLFGGLCNFEFNDLWKYDPLINQWTWVKGSHNGFGNFGIQGVPSFSNLPPQLSWGVASWVDLNGDFWIYGGNNPSGIMNDLWKYNISSNEWTWMNGNATAGQSPVYGIQGIPSISNTPGARWECNSTWVDDSNNLWLFGGRNIGTGFNNDIWKYNTSINQWTWIKGANFPSQPPVYGIKGITDTLNDPGGRSVYCHWKDSKGNIWFFGGASDSGACNDMWMYTMANNCWTWMSGNNQVNGTAIYGTQCIPSVYNIPYSRYENRCFWTDSLHNFWLYGGGLGSLLTYNFGDLWTFNPNTFEWTFVSGNTISNQFPVYGTIGIPSVNNKPGGRSGSIGWYANDGRLYLFGGCIHGMPIFLTRNDLWKYEINPNCPTIATVPPIANFIANDTNICQGTCINFFNSSIYAGTNYWFFPGAQVSTSSQLSPTICYNNPGIFDVSLVVCNSISCDTLVFPNYIHVDSLPIISLGPDTILCYGDSILLDPGNGFNSYLWNNGSTNQSILTNSPGIYSVNIALNACLTSDTIVVSTQACAIPNALFYSTDSSFCEKKCIDFTDISTNNPTSWLWILPGANIGATSSQNPTNICYNSYGSFDITLIACNAVGCDTLVLPNFINVFQNPSLPVVTINFDTLFSSFAYSYQWYNSNGKLAGETNQYYVFQQQGNYFVIITDSNGCASASNLIYTGINNLDSIFGEVCIFPNPNSGNFEIILPEETNKIEYFILYDITGRILFKSEFQNINHDYNIDLSDQANGIYFIRIKSGNKIWNGKILLNQ